MKVKIALKKGSWIASRDLDRSAEETWRIITDTMLWPSWGPSVISVTCRDRFIRAESRGRLRTTLGFRIPFAVTDYVQGRYWGWQVGGVSATGHRVIPLDAHRSRLEFEVPWWAAPYILVCLIALQRIARLGS